MHFFHALPLQAVLRFCLGPFLFFVVSVGGAGRLLLGPWGLAPWLVVASSRVGWLGPGHAPAQLAALAHLFFEKALGAHEGFLRIDLLCTFPMRFRFKRCLRFATFLARIFCFCSPLLGARLSFGSVSGLVVPAGGACLSSLGSWGLALWLGHWAPGKLLAGRAVAVPNEEAQQLWFARCPSFFRYSLGYIKRHPRAG